MRDFLVREQGFHPADMVVLTDDQDPNSAYSPNGQNMMSAIKWLVTGNTPGDSLFLHYSGHGGQVPDPDGDRESSFDDTIVPLDYESHGQLDSDLLHKALVSPMDPQVRLTVIFDCCHSGSAIELPYVYRADENGNVHLMDNVKQAAHLYQRAQHLVHGFSLTPTKIQEAKELFAGAQTFWKGFQNRGQKPVDVDEEGLGEEHFIEPWAKEGKDVWMFSGCRDDQTSADTSISGAHVGAMSNAFLATMRASPGESYRNVLQNTRKYLARNYKQIPQLSVGGKYDLDQPVRF
ncbi:hypothetical protein FRB94_010313 [Tulasnella sp. JGI-2019a]|nr:hypothetical protein FRB94_010313 [Tulasnella sp. JGI-2019a]